MTELGFDGGEVVDGDRPAWVGRLRRWLLLFVIAVLCGAAYLAGIWTGMNTHFTCATTGPGSIVCGNDGQLPTQPPAPPSGTPTV